MTSTDAPRGDAQRDAAGVGGVERLFEARVEAVPEIVALVAGRADACGLDPRRVRQLELAVEEAVVNICSYAYEVPPGELLVRVGPCGPRFVVELVDEGVPFDPLAVDEPDLGAGVADRAVGGLGILLARRMMDEVGYRRDGTHNILTLVVQCT